MYWHRLDLKFIGRKFFGEGMPPPGFHKVNASSATKFLGKLGSIAEGGVLVKNSSR